jgi:hypothetical protein
MVFFMLARLYRCFPGLLKIQRQQQRCTERAGRPGRGAAERDGRDAAAATAAAAAVCCSMIIYIYIYIHVYLIIGKKLLYLF